MQITSLFDLGSCDSGRMVASKAFQMVIEELSAKSPPHPPLTCNSPDDRQMALSMIRKSQENRNMLFERVEHGNPAEENGDHWMSQMLLQISPFKVYHH